MLAILGDDEECISAEIYITPPDQSVLNDEDSGPEDDGRTMDNVTGNQLRSGAEAVIHKVNGVERKGSSESIVTDASDSDAEGADVLDVNTTGVDDSDPPFSKKRKNVLFMRFFPRQQELHLCMICLPVRNQWDIKMSFDNNSSL